MEDLQSRMKCWEEGKDGGGGGVVLGSSIREPDGNIRSGAPRDLLLICTHFLSGLWLHQFTLLSLASLSVLLSL